MPQFNLKANRLWNQSQVAPGGWQRTGLYNDRPRSPEGNYSTLVRHEGPGEVTMQPFPFDWEVFLLEGDLELDGTRMSPGDHCAVAAGETITGRTLQGCQHLIIARSIRNP